MTKRTLIAYTFLFLFVFTFAFSFMLASKAQAALDCCIIEWCGTCNPPRPGVTGHDKFIIGQGTVCVYEALPPCDGIFECCD
ncbi:MAG: hypothetical protein NTW07_09320 [candidate division Zixibacteria bacterium]|nr:hypothetical protein [candidate division Zixibacteria bacterium]